MLQHRARQQSQKIAKGTANDRKAISSVPHNRGHLERSKTSRTTYNDDEARKSHELGSMKVGKQGKFSMID